MEKKLKILLLEDNWDDIGLIRRVLKKEGLLFESECVNTKDEFHKALLYYKPDVIISDHGLPQFNSTEALKICRLEKVEVPFILVTGTVSEEFALSSLRQGADDYILKSNLIRLPSAIKRALRQRKLVALRLVSRRKLRSQNRELSKVNQELDKFVYSVSHNLRAPLASVTGLLYLAKEEDKEGKFCELIDLMEDSINKLDNTLKEIVEYSQNVRSEIANEEIIWKEFIENCFAKLHYLYTGTLEKNIEIQENAPFYSDKVQLGIIFHNILTNSILYQEFNRPLDLFIRIFLNYGKAVIIISDNGIGIREEVLPKVFDMFYRGTERSKGAGLGLYIVKEMVAKLKGTISLVSVPNEGTTIVIHLPNMLRSDHHV